MSRYIDADALEQHKFISWTMPEFFNEQSLEQQAYQVGWNNAIEEIMENEPTADVVEVVRCRDCTWWKSIFSWNGKEHKVCVRESYEPPREQNDFCSYGERKEDEQIH